MTAASEGLPAFSVRSNYQYATTGARMHGATDYLHFPVHLCMPIASGVAFPDRPLELRDQEGKVLPADIRPLTLWEDGSVRAWEIDFPVCLQRTETGYFTLHRAVGNQATITAPALQLPTDFTVILTLQDGSELRAEVQFSRTELNAAECQATTFTDEQAFTLRKFGEFGSFQGVLIRKCWNWYSGMELAFRLTNCCFAESVIVKDVRLEYSLPQQGRCHYYAKHARYTADGPRLVESGKPFVVHADADGIHVTDLSQFDEVQTDYPPYERGAYLEATEAWLGMGDTTATWVLTIPDAIERMPKGWHMTDGHVVLQIHPDWAKPLEWRQGMSLYQRSTLSRLVSNATIEEVENEALRWLRRPLVDIDSENYRNAGWRIPFIYEPQRFPRTEYDILRTWGFNWSMGTFDWGDDYLPGKGTRNHEYDFIANALKEYARTGRTELFKLASAAAEHMMYTDFVPFSADPWIEGGVPAHCSYHTTGSAYPSHMWVEGLLLYYLMTGDSYALHVSMRVGDFFLKYIHERFQVIEGTGREMGWTLVALAALYDLTHEDRYLDGVKVIVDRYLDAGAEQFFPTDATFAVGVGLIGLDRIRPFYRGDEIAVFIPAVLDWLVAHRCDGIGLFDYWYDAERRSMYHIQTHLPEAFNIGYKLTGDVRYLKVAWRQFMIHQGGGVLTVENPLRPAESGIAGGYHISWTMGCLASFAERGWLESLQYADPEPEHTFSVRGEQP